MDDLIFDYKVVDIDLVQPNTWNPKPAESKEYQEVVKSVKTYGLRAPVTVREIDGGKYEIIDGYHRWKACKELGKTKVIINNQGQVPDHEAKRLTIVFQKVSVPFDEIMYAELMKGLADELGMETMLNTLPVSEHELEGYMKMADFDFEKEFSDTGIDANIADGMRALTIEFSKSQLEVVRQAIEKVKTEQGDETLSNARCIELICADFLAGQ